MCIQDRKLLCQGKLTIPYLSSIFFLNHYNINIKTKKNQY